MQIDKKFVGTVVIISFHAIPKAKSITNMHDLKMTVMFD